MSRLSVNVSVVVGANLIVRVQLTDGDRVWSVQLSVMILKGVFRGLLWAILPMIRSASPSLVMVRVWSD